MANYDELDDASKRVVDEVLKRYGLSAKPTGRAQGIASGLGAGASAAADAMASNRSAGVDAAIAAEQLSQARRGQATAEAGDAWKRMLHADYIKRGGMQSPGLAGQYSRPAPQVGYNAWEMSQNPAMLDELRRRASYDYEPFQFDPALLKAGKLEKGLGVGGAIGQGLGLAADLIPGGGVAKAIGKGIGKALKFIF